jgi:Flp pilus assembly protein TadD
LNNDTIPLQGWLNALVADADAHPEAGMVGSKLLFADGTIQHAGVVFDRQDLLPYHIYRGLAADLPAVNQRREFQVVTGACMLVRRDVFQDLGGFDEEYRNGFEDVDLCLKAGAKGHAVIYQPRSVLYHLESQTAGRKTHDQANISRFLSRWNANWWRGDADRQYHRDGYKVVRTKEPNRHALRLFADDRDKAMWAHVAATQTAVLTQDWAAARRELGAVQDWPAEADLLSWAATLCGRLHEPDLQRSFLSRYLELSDAPDVRLLLARTLLEEGDLAASERHLTHVLAADPTHGGGLLLRGILCMQREQYPEAEAAFFSALSHGADRKKCLMGCGMASFGTANAQGAWERFLEVLGDEPDDPDAIHWLLRTGTALERWAELCTPLRTYVERNPGDLSARFALAGVLLRGDALGEARREYAVLHTLAPGFDGLEELGQAIADKESRAAMEPAQR